MRARLVVVHGWPAERKLSGYLSPFSSSVPFGQTKARFFYKVSNTAVICLLPFLFCFSWPAVLIFCFGLSSSAYEQAFQLAESDAGRSCVLTAMGMLGYALSDKEGAKAMLFKRYSKHVTIENLLYTCFFWKKYVEVHAPLIRVFQTCDGWSENVYVFLFHFQLAFDVFHKFFLYSTIIAFTMQLVDVIHWLIIFCNIYSDTQERLKIREHFSHGPEMRLNISSSTDVWVGFYSLH